MLPVRSSEKTTSTNGGSPSVASQATLAGGIDQAERMDAELGPWRDVRVSN